MSVVTKRKYVFKEVHEEFVLPNETRQIAKILAANIGNNLHKVETHTGEIFLVSMPVKFRKNIYVKKDFFIMFTPIEEGKQVKGEITHILLKPQIEYIASSGLWPKRFECPVELKPSTSQQIVPATSSIPEDMLPSSSDDEDDDDSINEFKIRNPNRNYNDNDSDGDDDDDDDDCDEESNGGDDECQNNLVSDKDNE